MNGAMIVHRTVRPNESLPRSISLFPPKDFPDVPSSMQHANDAQGIGLNNVENEHVFEAAGFLTGLGAPISGIPRRTSIDSSTASRKLFASSSASFSR